jgi:hypothetical protein
LTFFGLTYGFTWLVLLPALLAARGLFALAVPDLGVIALAQFGPSFAALFLVWRKEGRSGVRHLLGRAFDLRIPAGWLSPTLLMPLALGATAAAPATRRSLRSTACCNGRTHAETVQHDSYAGRRYPSRSTPTGRSGGAHKRLIK